MRKTNTYRMMLRQRLVEIGPGRPCANRNSCPYVAMGVIQTNGNALVLDPPLVELIDEKWWWHWESWELLDLIDHLDGPVDFLVEP